MQKFWEIWEHIISEQAYFIVQRTLFLRRGFQVDGQCTVYSKTQQHSKQTRNLYIRPHFSWVKLSISARHFQTTYASIKHSLSYANQHKTRLTLRLERSISSREVILCDDRPTLLERRSCSWWLSYFEIKLIYQSIDKGQQHWIFIALSLFESTLLSHLFVYCTGHS